MKPRIVLASRNKKKLAELSAILGELDIEIIPLPDDAPEPEENGESFEENAVIKARSATEFMGLPALADDSGLCVDALNGAPGVFSARYGSQEYFEYAKTHGLKMDKKPLPRQAGDRDRVLRLLEDMSQIPDDKRQARFVCVIAYIEPGDGIVTVRGECEGVITHRMYGEGGFGYDPVFYDPKYGCTFAELEPEIKNSISHRAMALQKLKAALQEEFQEKF